MQKTKSRIVFLSVMMAAFVCLSIVSAPFAQAAENINSDNGEDGATCAQSVAMNIPPDMQQGSDNAVFTNVQPPSVRWQRADFIHSFCPEATAVDEAICSFISEALYNSGTEAVHTGVVMLC